jgi:hypothetical protein
MNEMNGMMRNVMIDLETYGTRPNSVIRSIGALYFDPESGKTGEEFYVNIQAESCLALGLVQDQATVDWWAKPQNAAANAQLAKDQIDLKIALQRFRLFMEYGGVYVWSQGANFDEPILASAYRAAKLAAPWRFYNARDTRTAYDFARFNPRTITREGTYHNALDDCRHQVACVVASHAKVYGDLSQ